MHEESWQRETVSKASIVNIDDNKMSEKFLLELLVSNVRDSKL